MNEIYIYTNNILYDYIVYGMTFVRLTAHANAKEPQWARMRSSDTRIYILRQGKQFQYVLYYKLCDMKQIWRDC